MSPCKIPKNVHEPEPISWVISTDNSPPEPDRVDPRIPVIPSTSIIPYVYPLPGSVNWTLVIVPELVSTSSSTVMTQRPPSPSPIIPT